MEYEQLTDTTYLVWEVEKNKALLQANDEAGFCRFNMDCETRGSGHWQLAGSAAANGVTWPAFEEVFLAEQRAYRDNPAVGVPFSERPWKTLKERTAEIDRRATLINSLPLYVPESMMLPWYLESELADLSLFNSCWGGKADPELLSGYFIGAAFRLRLFRRELSQITDTKFEEGLAIGLYRDGAAIPADALLPELSNSELRACLGEMGRVPARTKTLNLEMLEVAFILEDKRAEELVRNCRDWTPYACMMPPDGVDWMGFQGMRQQAKAMIMTLLDFFGGFLYRDGGRGQGRRVHNSLTHTK